ncbi:MAG: ArgE/DapE family deacylase [Nocardioidaceae bacterium]
MILNLDMRLLDTAVGRYAEDAFKFLERLVEASSTVGHENDALTVLGVELERLGFAVERLPLEDRLGDDPLAGVPSQSYAGRFDVIGRRGAGPGRSLMFNGHIDVVPADEPGLWTSDPFIPVRRDGWLWGRGAGDMKAGFAMGTLAIRALDAVAPNAVAGPLTFLGVIEEECTGNGTLAAARAGVLADAVVLLEPTDLNLMLGGVGILWVDIDVDGFAAHAESADRAVNPIDVALRLLPALRDFERELNADAGDPVFAHVDQPYNLNIGVIQAGDWPSSVPSIARLRLRLGYPRRWSPDEAERRVREVVAAAGGRDDWLASHPARVRCSGFRAEGYCLSSSDPLVGALSQAHADAHGERPSTFSLGSTTDARYYVNNFDRPALCYGPVARDIHGVDERVELDSIVRGAKTLVRFLASWWP